MRFPALLFTTIAGTVLFSSFAKLQDDNERLGQMFRRVLFSLSIFLIPASAGLIVLAPEAIRILLGPGWDAVVLPFQIMAVSMLFRTSYKASSLVARSAGDVFRIAAWQVFYAIAVIGGALISVRWGIVGVSITTGAAVVFHFFNLTRLALRQAPIGWGAVIGAHLDGLIMAGLAVVFALPTAMFMRVAGHGTTLTAVTTIATGVVLPTAYALFRIRRGAPDWTWLRDRVRQVVKKKKKTKQKNP
jgi:PST family polysaccharide transporter